MRASGAVLMHADDTPFYDIINKCEHASWFTCWLAALFGERRIISSGANGLHLAGYYWLDELWITELEDKRDLVTFLQHENSQRNERKARSYLWGVAAVIWLILLPQEVEARSCKQPADPDSPIECQVAAFWSGWLARIGIDW